jgi:hypothetical protein
MKIIFNIVHADNSINANLQLRNLEIAKWIITYVPLKLGGLFYWVT